MADKKKRQEAEAVDFDQIRKDLVEKAKKDRQIDDKEVRDDLESKR